MDKKTEKEIAVLEQQIIEMIKKLDFLIYLEHYKKEKDHSFDTVILKKSKIL